MQTQCSTTDPDGWHPQAAPCCYSPTAVAEELATAASVVAVVALAATVVAAAPVATTFVCAAIVAAVVAFALAAALVVAVVAVSIAKHWSPSCSSSSDRLDPPSSSACAGFGCCPSTAD